MLSTHDSPSSSEASVEAHRWPKILAAYREAKPARSVIELVITAVPLVVIWIAMAASLQIGYWLCLLLSIPAAGFVVRMFAIQHDCSHGAFFKRRATNDWIGRALGVFTLTPYDLWRRDHAIHHASAGNLDHRGIGDIETLTVREYEALTWRGRLAYRIYRHPIVMFGLAPAYLFLLQQRLPFGMMRAGWRPWVSAMATNLGIALGAGLLMWIIGVGPFLLIHLPIALIAASIGVWLFYVQHQFEHTFWAHDADWKHPEAALHGSSHYVLPGVLRWFTANIGVHHVHHLNSRIPYYRLPEVLRNHPELAHINRLTLLQSFGCVRLVLWDELRQSLVSFREARLSR